MSQKNASVAKFLAAFGGLLLAGAGLVYGFAHAEAKEEVRVEKLETAFVSHIEAFETQVDAFQAHVKAYEQGVERQRKLDEAQILKLVRQEYLLDEIARKLRVRPPTKPAAQRRAERAIGLNPDDSFESLSR
jgi:hypothetical protein